MSSQFEEQAGLILAAEDCDPSVFDQLHRFSAGDDRLIARLAAHGPVLLRGGRGCGKSALMIEASRRLAPNDPEAGAFGVYLSLRHLELLRATDAAYERLLCSLIIDKISLLLDEGGGSFNCEATVGAMQRALSRLSSRLGKRIVLFFDDAAHIGREASLAEFFDIFRTISSSTVSCKAAIYPGVTRYGTRFDVLNDATILDVSRNEDVPGFSEMFKEVMKARYPAALPEDAFSSDMPMLALAGFLGRAVLGNMRTFVFACNRLVELSSGRKVGLQQLSDALLDLAANHYWPMLEELRPKLGKYEPMIDPAIAVAEQLFGKCGEAGARRLVLVHRDITERLAKPFEMLEYVGFIAKREVSRAMKSRGRGTRYALNLCNLLEKTPGTRLTTELLRQFQEKPMDPVEFHRGSELMELNLPGTEEDAELGILGKPIDCLRKSAAYPYGLTDQKTEVLKRAGIGTVGDLASASDQELMQLYYVGDAMVKRFRNVVGQAVWM